MLRPVINEMLPSLAAGIVAYVISRFSVSPASGVTVSSNDPSPGNPELPISRRHQEHTLRDRDATRQVISRTNTPSATLADVRCVFKTFRAESPEARARLIRLAERVDSLTRARRYALDILEEIPIDAPFGPEILGLHYSPSSANHIAVRLREPQANGAWLPEDAVLATLCHELAHCEHGDHTPEFFALTGELCCAVGVAPDAESAHCAAATVESDGASEQLAVVLGGPPRDIAGPHRSSAAHFMATAVLAFALCALGPLLSLLAALLAVFVRVCVCRGGGRGSSGTVTVASAAMVFGSAIALSAVKASPDQHKGMQADTQDTDTALGDALGVTGITDPVMWNDAWDASGRWAAVLSFSLLYALVRYRGSCIQRQQPFLHLQQRQYCEPTAVLMPAATVTFVGLCGANPWLAVLVVVAAAAAFRAEPGLARWVVDCRRESPLSVEEASGGSGADSPTLLPSTGGRTLRSDSETAVLLPASSPLALVDENEQRTRVIAGAESAPSVAATSTPASRQERAAAIRAAAEAREAASLHPTIARKAAAAARAAAAADEEVRAAAARRRDWGSGRVGGSAPAVVGRPDEQLTAATATEAGGGTDNQGGAGP